MKRISDTPAALTKLSAIRLRRGCPRSKSPPLSNPWSNDRVSKLVFIFSVNREEESKQNKNVKGEGKVNRKKVIWTRGTDKTATWSLKTINRSSWQTLSFETFPTFIL